MKLFLEYLARREREKAAKEGQTNLRPTGKEEKEVKTEKKTIPTWLKNFRRAATWEKEKDRVYKNKIVDDNFRMVLTDTGQYYTCHIYSLIHLDLVGMMMRDGIIEPNEEQIFTWNETMPNKYIALVGNRKDNLMYLSESYKQSVVNAIAKDPKSVDKFIIEIKKLGYNPILAMKEIRYD